MKRSRTASGTAAPESPEQDKGAVVTAEIQWHGPLPPPAVIRGYNDVVVDGAERLFRQFEEEAAHRRKTEMRMIELQGRDLLVGKVLALVFAMAVLFATGFAISHDAKWVAALLGGGMLTTIVLAFMRVMGDKRTTKKKSAD